MRVRACARACVRAYAQVLRRCHRQAQGFPPPLKGQSFSSLGTPGGSCPEPEGRPVNSCMCMAIRADPVGADVVSTLLREGTSTSGRASLQLLGGTRQPNSLLRVNERLTSPADTCWRPDPLPALAENPPIAPSPCHAASSNSAESHTIP